MLFSVLAHQIITAGRTSKRSTEAYTTGQIIFDIQHNVLKENWKFKSMFGNMMKYCKQENIKIKVKTKGRNTYAISTIRSFSWGARAMTGKKELALWSWEHKLTLSKSLKRMKIKMKHHRIMLTSKASTM